ncbi:hypothetical protein K437DRAFT_278429 [Tilletiaria anomala UBC 951]|uniref:Endonuclease/exonuclease/phosphatase domain-containing protein n=1 Tax=Tilletiaria anomala (strain ATCC 24038 / CBS 436.72 / UBC 951) TaxID=1037660 RepID=A0A066VZ75_TILAU|nr:uncharacterized protein K437DRAFT_278429 [Tilletiaria anomala UBC 951]KDN45593.1 hypothetical protein K437DRAFT_278429 [Tilletiaria anomala UBC 951]
MLEYSLRPEGQVRIVSWNVSSFNSCEKKGLFKYLEVEQPDIVVLTETKVNEAPDMHPGLSAYPHRYWGIDAKTKGYAGVAVFSKIKPLKATIGMPLHPKEYNGRIITLEFSKHFLVGTYVTNAGEGLAKMSNKQQWNAAFAEYIKELDAQKPVIWCGDLNVMLDQRDLSAPKKKWNKQPGYSKIECDAHRVLLEGKDRGEGRKLVDVWRVSHPDAVGHFTFYSFRGACRGKGIGWRLDSFIISERALGSDKSRAFVQQCEIRHEVYGPSDHVPVICDVLGPL